MSDDRVIFARVNPELSESIDRIKAQKNMTTSDLVRAGIHAWFDLWEWDYIATKTLIEGRDLKQAWKTFKEGHR